MTSISQLRNELFSSKLQVLLLSPDGQILESEDSLFPAKKGTNLGKLHPFFEGISPLLEDLQEPLHFPCVFLEIDDASIIADVDIITKDKKVFVTVFDFTEHYEQSHPLVQEKNEAHILKHKLAYERDLLLAKEDFKNRFLTHLNHEIRNPLNSMFGFMEILENSKLDYEQKEALNVLHKTGTHLKVLMDDLLDISKIEQGDLQLREVSFGFNELMSSLTKHFQLKYAKKPIFLGVEILKGVPPRLVGDPTRLNQILFNLVENAFRNTDKGNIQIEVSCDAERSKEDKVVLDFKITDTGRGIAEENLSQIFESYYQINLDEIKPLGQGLGLKIVKDLVSLQGGVVSVTSTEGKGSTFTVTLPYQIPPKRDKKRKTVPKGSGIVLSKRILVVEDNEVDQMLFVKSFIEEGKYAIELAPSGSQALEMLEKKDYSLVVLKTGLPEMDGFELTRQIRAHANEKISSLPILVVSGNVMLQQQQRIMDAGATTFLAKPYTNRELFKKVESVIQ